MSVSLPLISTREQLIKYYYYYYCFPGLLLPSESNILHNLHALCFTGVCVA